MNIEIERKFLCKNLSDLSKITPIKYERYYIVSRLPHLLGWGLTLNDD